MNFTAGGILVFALLMGSLLANPELANLFTDHAVLQRDRTLPIWGNADPGEKITVSLGKETATTISNDNGEWQVKLAAQQGSNNPLVLKISGKTAIERHDILLGDVWLCSGQSNMDLTLSALGVSEEIASAKFPEIRSFRVAYHFANTPADQVEGQWRPCSPATAPSFSAVGYYFAKRIHAETGVPIGLLTNAVGGTNIELWISQEKLLHTPSLESYAKALRSSLITYQAALKAYLPTADAWLKRANTEAKQGHDLPLPPERPEYPFSDRAMKPRCVTLYNGMLAPLAPFALRGVIWYQGENNSDDGLIYVDKMKALIDEWRACFQNPELPFYFVQLAMFQHSDNKPEGGGWGQIRDAQRRCLSIPQTGMACAIDIGDAQNIHPKNKEDVGSRLERWALKSEYGQKDLIVSGPLYENLEMEGDKLRLYFTSLGGGLITAVKTGSDAAMPTPAVELKRFSLAGADQKWFWAHATIDGQTIVLNTPEVLHPIAARYAYSSNPEGANLYNRAGLPASPFRTDDW